MTDLIFTQSLVKFFSQYLPEEFSNNFTLKTLEEIIGKDRTNLLVLKDEFSLICETETMKKGTKFMIDELIDPSSKADIVFITFKADNKIKGFCSVKEHNCLPEKKVLSIQFICTNIRGISKILLGVSLFAAKILNYDIACLQVDRGFENPNAYCAYLKIGFEYNPNLLKKCFSFNKKQLPMSFDLSLKTKEDILALVKKSRAVDDILCNIEDRQRQLSLGQMRQGFFSIVQCFSSTDCKYKNLKELKSVPSILHSTVEEYIKSDDNAAESVLTYLLDKDKDSKFRKYIASNVEKRLKDSFYH